MNKKNNVREENFSRSSDLTIVISRKVKKGSENQFRMVIEEMKEELKKQSGFKEIKDISKSIESNQLAISLITFSNLDDFLMWEQSSNKKKIISKLKDLVEGDVQKELLGDVNLLAQSDPTPERWKTVLVLIGWIFVLGAIVQSILSSILPSSIPSFLFKLVSISITVLLISYWTLPYSMKLIKKLSKA